MHMRYPLLHWNRKQHFSVPYDEKAAMGRKGETEDMTKKEVLEMLDDMEDRILCSNGFIAGFVTQGFILKLIDKKREEVEALEEK